MHATHILSCVLALAIPPAALGAPNYQKVDLGARDVSVELHDFDISVIANIDISVGLDIDAKKARRDSEHSHVAIDRSILDHQRKPRQAQQLEQARRNTTVVPNSGIIGYNWDCTTVHGPDPLDCPDAISQWQDLTNTGEPAKVHVQGGRCVSINYKTCMAFACAPKGDVVVSSVMVSSRLMNPVQVRCTTFGLGGVWANGAGNDTTLKVGLLVNPFQDLPEQR
ncbi:hypothetical protein CFO_g5524 [Ceratocystis platani]|uniref:Uncharacterized protein n=1 Tax=Ceratocystis fimbriata f. sp. platani TaxID=88771 RepID=A0A0F8CN12_CERFI|nr:hypothetical protein CFO_g5524 [Ceratocystis platani]